MTSPRRTVVLLAVLALLLSGCSFLGSSGGKQAEPEPEPTLTPSPIGSATPDATATAEPSLGRFYDQKLTWKKCRDTFQCSTLTVPLDYAKPDARAITLSLLRLPARDAKRRIGSLVVNPGGPGVSGVDYAASAVASFGRELRSSFDVVGFDPRGVGLSTPLKCEGTAELDTLIASDPDPDTPAETAYSDGLLEKLGRDCVRKSGALVRHMSTVEVAKDLDVLRAALGDRRLSYFGASYGTFIGATYAQLFPGHVGRMVLDGALDPSLSSLEVGVVQAKAFEVALRAYVGACVDRGGCFLGSSVDAGTRRIREFFDSVEKRPLPTGGTRDLEIGNALVGVWLPLYVKSYWPILDSALKAAFGGNGAQLMTLADSYVSRGPDGYRGNGLEAIYAVNCLDHDDGVASSDIGQYEPRFLKASPTFGRVFAYGLSTCSSWPVHSGHTGAPLEAKGAPPIMVVGTTRDPATPLVWARSLADQLDSGVLVKRDGDGHTGYRAGNRCVDTTVESYLVEGKVPIAEVDC